MSSSPQPHMEGGGGPHSASVAIVGPTAVGKSALAVWLAERIGGEVVNCDSMQLYRGMDIGTGKITRAERRGVPHHLLDVWDLHVEGSVAEFQRLGREAIADVRSRGRVPVLVGGSGLYARAIIDDLRFPGTDRALRRHWEEELARRGPVELHAEIEARDPAAAAAILPSNGRRIVRALEVMDLTGTFTASLPRGNQSRDWVRIGLELEGGELDGAIADRVDEMLRRGMVSEVERLRGLGLDAAPTASRALGYSHVIAHLDGRLDGDSLAQEITTATRRFARRQLRWFRRDARIEWLDAGDPAVTRARALDLVRRDYSPSQP